MVMKHPRNAVLAGSALLALLGSGYYVGSRADDPATAAQAASVDLSLPLDRYRLSYEGETDYYRAEDLLIRVCMEEAGYEWHVPADPPPRANPNRRRYGVIDPDVAERYGYHPPPDGTSDQTLELRNETLQQPGAEDTLRSCDEGAVERLTHGAGQADFALLDDLYWSSLEEAEDHPAVVDAKQDWQECMRSHGYSYETSRDALSDEQWDLNAPVSTGAERAVAVADVGCKYEVGLVDAYVQAETEIQQGYIDENGSELEPLIRKNRIYQQNAHAVLEELDAPRGS
jgi:hypothetical protein